MMLLPVKINMTQYALFIILSKDNLGRIERYDPTIVNLSVLSAEWHQLMLQEITVTFATEAESRIVMEFVAKDLITDAVKLLTRGFVYRPEHHDLVL